MSKSTSTASRANARPPSNTKSENQPVHTIRYRNLKGTIWKNSGANGDFYSITFSRSYQDKEEKWHDVASFNFNDLPMLAKIANDCHSWIAWQERRAAEEAQKGQR